jgi:DNA replication protein DnaC
MPLDYKLTQLKLGRIRQIYPQWLERAGETEMSYAEFLDELLAEELLARQENQIRKRMRLARFPFEASLEQFDWNLRPELKRTVMLRYFDSAFVEKGGNLLLIGASGLGKTLLAVAVGTRMVQLGYEVRFITAQELANSVLKAANRQEIERIIGPLIKCQLLILDELGYLPLDHRVGPTLYEVISGRYLKGATIITSNKSLSNWGEMIGGTDMALMMAIIDRLLHQGEAYYFKGPSLRLRGKDPLNLNGSGNGAGSNGSANGAKPPGPSSRGQVETNVGKEGELAPAGAST